MSNINWINEREAAVYLNLPSHTLQYARVHGLPVAPYYKFGNQTIRYRREDLDRAKELARVPRKGFDETEAR